MYAACKWVKHEKQTSAAACDHHHLSVSSTHLIFHRQCIRSMFTAHPHIRHSEDYDEKENNKPKSCLILFIRHLRFIKLTSSVLWLSGGILNSNTNSLYNFIVFSFLVNFPAATDNCSTTSRSSLRTFPLSETHPNLLTGRNNKICVEIS